MKSKAGTLFRHLAIKNVDYDLPSHVGTFDARQDMLPAYDKMSVGFRRPSGCKHRGEKFRDCGRQKNDLGEVCLLIGHERIVQSGLKVNQGTPLSSSGKKTIQFRGRAL